VRSWRASACAAAGLADRPAGETAVSLGPCRGDRRIEAGAVEIRCRAHGRLLTNAVSARAVEAHGRLRTNAVSAKAVVGAHGRALTNAVSARVVEAHGRLRTNAVSARVVVGAHGRLLTNAVSARVVVGAHGWLRTNAVSAKAVVGAHGRAPLHQREGHRPRLPGRERLHNPSPPTRPGRRSRRGIRSDAPRPLRFGIDGRRVLTIHGPARRVIQDVLADPIQGVLIADDVFVVVALPDRRAGSTPRGVDALRRRGLEPRDEGSQRTR